jgi:predicted transposase/invertase (TIGR01784 family)
MADLTGITPFRQLPLSDNFMFAQVMRQPEICQMFLEELLGVSIARLEFIGTEQDISDGENYHGIRLDVYVNDVAQTRYNIEMQNAQKRSLERRVRYYQSGIDRNFLAKGADYSELPESYVIFICDFDYYKKGLACYERIWKIKDAEDLTVNDGSHSILLNSRYETANVSPAIQDFLDYIRTKDDHHPYASNLVKKAVAEVERLRVNKELEVTYMTWKMSLQDERMIGREEGIQIGEERGMLSTLISLVTDRTIPYQIGLERSGLTEEEFRAKLAEVDPDFQR